MERLLERDDELGMLTAVVDGAAAGAGALVFVGGEAGAGKTSLVRALRERAGARAAFLFGGCEPLSVPIPLGPWRELAEAAAADQPLPPADDPLSLTRHLLEVLGSRAPAVAVVEDAHWADPLTLDVIRLLARRLEAAGVAVLVTYRDDEVESNPALQMLLGDLATSPSVRRMKLRPLSESAVAELAAPHGIDPAELARATGGNPFLVVESVAAEGRLPASVRDAALARAGRLGTTARAVVDAAAVIGQRFTPALLESVAPGTAEAVEEALARAVLVADGPALGFRHELIRNAIEASIPPPRRAELHGRVLGALAAGPDGADSARLAHHAELGGRLPEATRYAIDAAAEAERMGALREARLQAERALRIGHGLDDEARFDLLVRYIRAANFSDTRLEEVVAAGREAVALANRLADPRQQARALMILTWALWSADRVLEARRTAEQAVSVLAPVGDDALLARALSTVIRMEATAFDPAAAVSAAPEALELARRAGLEETRLEVEISVALAHAHGGDRTAVPMLAEALARARGAGYAIQTVRAYINLAYAAVSLRDHGLADQTVAEALIAFEEYHAPIPALAAQSFLARSRLDRGQWDVASDLALRSEAMWHAEVPSARSIRGLIAARRGDPAGAELIGRAWEEIAQIAESSRHGMLRLAQIELAWLRGDRAGATAAIHAAAAAPSTTRFARPAAEMAVWGRRHGIEVALPANAPAAVRLELAGDWRGAIRAWRELSSPYEAALAALPGDERSAREAQRVLHRLGATAAARAFARERSAAGARAGRSPRRSTLANAAGLTRREQEVLGRLATGATNTQIAAALHLSERTVAHHVSAILGKLDAGNRVIAIERARELGLLAGAKLGPPVRRT